MSEFTDAMTAACWAYDGGTVGFRRGDLWVSFLQAKAAYDAAVAGETVKDVEPLSETCAEILAGRPANG
jgi:hypothetical protein